MPLKTSNNDATYLKTYHYSDDIQSGKCLSKPMKKYSIREIPDILRLVKVVL
jgi:hypothetical protein